MNDWRQQLIRDFGWENDEAVERWLAKLRVRRYAYLCFNQGLKIHCEKVGKTPNQLVEERIGQLQSRDPRIRSQAEDTVLRIYQELADEKPGAAINYFRKMKSFYRHNYCALGCTEPEYCPQNHAEDRKALEKLSREKIRAICERAQLETRLAILLLAESGGRIGAVMSLTYKDVRDDLESGTIPAAIWLKQQSRKKGGTYPSFICGDALRLLRLIIEDRKPRDEDGIFTIGKAAVQGFLRDHQLYPHLLRKRCQVILEERGVPVNWIDRLLGHTPRGAQGATYSIPPIAKLREQYCKAMKELQIYGGAEPPLNGDLKEYISKALSKVLSRYLSREIREQEIAQALEGL